MSQKRKVALAILILFIICLLGRFGAHHITLDQLNSRHLQLKGFYTENPIETLSLFTALYIGYTALSLPGATVLTVSAGVVFGFWIGLGAVCLASNIGATLAFLTTRFLFRDYFQKKLGHHLDKMNEGVKKDGAYYLFALRIIPTFPFFLVNSVMGLTPISVKVFFLASLVGMLPATAIYVQAGSQLSQIHALSDLISPGLLFTFSLLGLLPLALKKVLNYTKPKIKKPQQP